MVFFGGYGNTYLGDAWKFDLVTLKWSPLTSNTPEPAGRVGNAAVYDSIHDRMVLYGGIGFGDLWAYEFDNARWVQLPQGAPTPGNRGWASVIYNPRDTTMVLFGGQDFNGNFFNALWILDLNRLTWRQVSPGAGWPDTRIAASVALDGATNTLWMFGGFHRPGDFDFNELWSLNLTTLQWVQHPLGSPVPIGRAGTPAFFDPVNRSMVIFGGISHNTNQALNDLWAYSVDGGTWQQLPTTGDIPTFRGNLSAIFVPSQNRFVIFGGLTFPTLNVLGDTYILNTVDGTWQKISAGQPSARYNSATTSGVYASSINSMAFFGGHDANVYMDDAWRLDLSTLQWSPLTSSTPAPPGRLAHGAVYDAAHGRMVLYGGFAANYTEFQDLWAYEFATGKWVELNQGSPKPGDRAWAAVIYNPRDTTMLLFGGQDLDGNFFNDVWILDLNRIVWRKVTPSQGWPAPRVAPEVALDEQQNTMWMFGGFYRSSGDFDYNEIWSLDLTTLQWTQHPLGTSAPLMREAAPAFFEPSSRAVVIFGGISHNTNQALNDLWAYYVDSHVWQQLYTNGDIPSPRHNGPGVYIPAQNRFVLFGGLGFPTPTVFGDAYALNLNPLPPGCRAVRGDLNADGNLTPSDLVLLLNCAFLGIGSCDLCFADVSCNGILNAVDVLVLLNAVFLNIPLDCSP